MSPAGGPSAPTVQAGSRTVLITISVADGPGSERLPGLARGPVRPCGDLAGRLAQDLAAVDDDRTTSLTALIDERNDQRPRGSSPPWRKSGPAAGRRCPRRAGGPRIPTPGSRPTPRSFYRDAAPINLGLYEQPPYRLSAHTVALGPGLRDRRWIRIPETCSSIRWRRCSLTFGSIVFGTRPSSWTPGKRYRTPGALHESSHREVGRPRHAPAGDTRRRRPPQIACRAVDTRSDISLQSVQRRTSAVVGALAVAAQ